MIEDKIKIDYGKVETVNNIIEDHDMWVFENGDPNIHIVFNEPIIALRISVLLKKTLNQQIHTTIYFKNNGEVFSEEKSYHYDIYLNKVSIDDIYFSSPVEEIRFDIADQNIMMDVESMSFNDLTKLPFDNVLRHNFNNCQGNEGVLLITHDLSQSGAPILAYNIASKLQINNIQVSLLVCSSNTNQMTYKYNELEIPMIFLDDKSKNISRRHYVLVKASDENIQEDYISSIISAAYQLGYRKVIANTVVSGVYAKQFKQFDFLVITLVHEMKVAIQLLGLDSNESIAKYSDFIVFPDDVLLHDFKELFKQIAGEMIVRPQGIYLKKSIGQLNKEEIDLKAYGLDVFDRYIMGSGIANLCKGIDLFISAATILHQLDDTLHFIWTGNFTSDNELKKWMYQQIAGASMQDKIHIIPFINDQKVYQTLLSNAKAFWLTSRGDSFPSVVLEAMDFNIPVIGFKNSGGINTIADNNRGILVENFDVNALAEETHAFLHKSKYEIDQTSIKAFIQQLDFDQYVYFLCDLLARQKNVKLYEPIYFFDKKYKDLLENNLLQLEQKKLDSKKAKFKNIFKYTKRGE